MGAAGYTIHFPGMDAALMRTPLRVLLAVATAMSLLACGACAQRWTFAEPRFPGSGLAPDRSAGFEATGPAGPYARFAAMPATPGSEAAAVAPPVAGVIATGAVLPEPSGPSGQPSPESGCGPSLVTPSPPSLTTQSGPPVEQPTFGQRLLGFGHDVSIDYTKYYSWIGMVELAAGVGVAAPLANTSVDQETRDWYQRQVRTSGTDQAASWVKPLGEGAYMIPAGVALGLAGMAFDDNPWLAPIGEFGQRMTRAYAVGAPPFLLMQYGLGAARPSDHGDSSWHPFKDSHGASGHAFISSVPFITAAKMTDDLVLKSGLYFCSTLTGWSRINDDAHYFSQVVLGWWMGYLACAAVDETNLQNRRFHVAPVVTPEMTGFALMFSR